MVARETELAFVESLVSSGAKASSSIGVEAVDLEGEAISQRVGDEGTLGRCDFVAPGKMVCRALSWLSGIEPAATDGGCWLRSMTVAHGFCRAPAFGRRGVGDAAVGGGKEKGTLYPSPPCSRKLPHGSIISPIFFLSQNSDGALATSRHRVIINHNSHNKAGWRKGIRPTINPTSANRIVSLTDHASPVFPPSSRRPRGPLTLRSTLSSAAV